MQLTSNFKLSEFDCKDGTRVPTIYIPNAIKVAKNLQVLRNRLGRPVIISGSGYRTASHNKKVGGAPKSKHLTCSAADIKVPAHGELPELTPRQVAHVIEELIAEGEMDQGGIGVYATFVHYDVRGEHARW